MMIRRVSALAAPVCLFCLLCLTLACALASPAAAADLPAEKRVIYGFDREFPPFSFETEGQPTGFEVDIAKAVFRDSPYKFILKPLNWDKVQLQLSGGDIHLTSGMAKTKQRLLLYNFSDRPLLPLNVKLFTKSQNRVGNANLLRGKTVSVHKGSYYQRVLEDFGGLNIKLYKTELDALKALYQDEVEAFGGGDKTAYYYINKLKLGGINAVGTPLKVTNVYFAVNRSAPDVLKMVNDGMRRIMESGEYDRIYRRWFVQELTREDVATLRQAATDAAVNAYAPYSNDPVGAAVLTRSGRIYTGANVENMQLGQSASALKVAVYKAVTDGETELRAVLVARPGGLLVPPTADERQTLYEFGRGVLAVLEPEKGDYVIRTISELLPFAEDNRKEE
ncbi:MAG: cytidine deaminase [Desulfovibrionaceae bacterium]